MRILTILLFLFLVTPPAYADLAGGVSVKFNGEERFVTYRLYLPASISDRDSVPMIVCSGGVPMKDNQYVRSSTEDCLSQPWKVFAEENHMAILGLGFLFDEMDWPVKQSYQFPHAWSGKAVDKILKKVSSEYPVDYKRLYLYGVSGGSQFSVRYAFYRSHWVKGVAAHAAGSYDPPVRKNDVQFLITVGELDNDKTLRLDMAREFAEALTLFDISHQLVIVEGIAHRQTEEQNEMSRDFFAKIMQNNKGIYSKAYVVYVQPPALPMGLSLENVLKVFPHKKARTHRSHGDEQFLTYLYGPEEEDFITLHIKNNVLFNWGLNSRREIVDEYLTEFLSGGSIRRFPKTFKAIRGALGKLPQEPFMKVVDRNRLVIFLDVSTGGIARYANAIDFYFREEDPPALSRGFYLIKLGGDLEQANDSEAIEGIIFHELAHHVLDHLRNPVDCDTEKEANRLVNKWGFTEEFKKASDQFGAKFPEDSPCFEERVEEVDILR